MRQKIILFNKFIKENFLLFKVQLLIYNFILVAIVWNIASFIKINILSDYIPKLHPWTAIYFHPLESNLLNYLFVCIVIGIVSFITYALINSHNKELVKNKIANKNIVVVLLSISLISLLLLPFLSILQRIIMYSIILFLPLPFLISLK